MGLGRAAKHVHDLRAFLVEGFEDLPDRGFVRWRQSEGVLFFQYVQNRLQAVLEKPDVGCDAAISSEEVFGERARLEAFRTRPGEEPREEVGAIFRQLEERLVHQVLHRVLPSDIDDEGDPRPERGDIGEVLLGSDTQENPARGDGLLESREDLLEVQLVRDVVLVFEIPVRFREIDGELPEGGVVERL